MVAVQDLQGQLADVRAVRRHAEVFGRTWGDQAWQRQVFDRAREARRTALLPDFDVVRDDAGADFLVANGVLLVRAEDLDARAGGLAAGLGLAPEPIAALDGRVVRLVRAGATGAELQRDAAALRRKGVPATLNFVPPMAVVMKSQGGAEPSARRWPSPPAAPAPTAGPVRVAVVDTGLTRQTRSDGWLAGLAVDPGNIDELDVSPANGLLDAAAGHGTAVAGLIQHEAPEVPIAMYAAVPPDGAAFESDIAAAMVTAVRDGFAARQSVVLNLSLGTTTIDDRPALALQVALDIIDELSAAEPDLDVLVVAAAGNYGTDKPVWPAAARGVVAVGALTQSMLPAPWSSHGHWVDCSVIGDGVLSVYVEGEEDPFFDTAADSYGPDPWALHFGTSFAAPQVSGRVAHVAVTEKVDLHDALGRVLTRARRIPDLGRTLAIQPPIG